MPDKKHNKNEVFDRQAYLKEIRMALLKKLGLPEETKPEQVARLLEIKASIAKKNQSKH